MSDQTPPAETEVDEFTEALFAAMERRQPSPSPSADQAPDTEAVAPGGEDPVEGQEPPPPESAPEAPPEEAPPVEEQPEGEVPEEGGPPGEGDGQPSPAFTLSGRDYSNEQVAQALPLYDWFARLDPGQVQAIDALLSGTYRLVPASEAAQPQPSSATSGTPASSPSPPPAEDEGEWLDTKAQREITALRQQMAEMQQVFTQNLQPVVQTQQQADYDARLGAINQSHAEFQQRYQLPDEAMDALEVTIAESQVLPGLAHRHGGIKAGMDAALDMAFWSTPVYRDRYLASRQASKEAEQVQEDTAAVRKQHLTALSGSGGSAPRREPVPATAEDRHAAMVAEIASAMNGSGQVQ